MIMLHGFGASLHTWEPWAQALSGDHRVIRFDLPGFGLTGADPSGDYSDARSVQVLAALMDRLGLQRASLVGNSIGGKIAWKFAALHPDAGRQAGADLAGRVREPGLRVREEGRGPGHGQADALRTADLHGPPSLAPAYGDPTVLTDELVTRYRDLMLAPGVRTP